MKKILLLLSFIIGYAAFSAAQNVTRTQHRTAVTTDAVTTGTVTIRKPDYICISTDEGREQLIMDGTQFTMTIGGKQHVTDGRTNPQFATFHEVLLAVIGGKAVAENDEVTVTKRQGQRIVVVTPPAQKHRQMFTSFTLVIDAGTSALKSLQMNERKGNFIRYEFN